MKILVVLSRFPYPLEKGDKLRAYHQIVELSKHHEIYLFCVSHDAVTEEQREALRPYCRKIKVVRLNRVICVCNVVRNWFLSKSLQMGYWNTKCSKRAYRAFECEVQPDVVYNQMVRTMPLVARSHCRKVMDFQDALSLNTERRMVQSHGLWRYILHFEFKMLRSSEYNAFNFFDALTIISEADSEAIPHKKNGDIKIVRNGIDFDHFRPMDMAKTTDIVFCGNMQYAPNVDAARFLALEVMPIVWRSHPEARLTIAGATPKAAVRRLEGPKVTVTGTVDDIRPCYAQARIFMAPMRIGSGMQNKLLEAMAMGIPCITTPLAWHAASVGTDDPVALGTTAEELAAAACALLDDEQRRRELADRAMAFVHEHFSWQKACGQLEQILTDVAHL